MKTKLVVLLLIAGITMFQLLNSCRHEFSHDYCQTNPILLTATATNAISAQANGTITATATGGSGFKYRLNDGAYKDTGYFSGLPASAQDYMVIAKNSWGCMDTAYVTVGSTNPCSGVTIVVATTKIDATTGQSNGSVTASATGGTGFTYSINGTTFQSSGTFSGLAAGNYTITAKNANGCTGTGQVTIGTNNPCTGVTIVVTTTKVDPAAGQSNGSITASATGGTGFTYSINGTTFQTSGTFNGLAAGSYTVTAKNSNGCTGIAQVVLGTNNPCTGVTITVTLTKVDPTSGANGSITASAAGGTGFTYSLNSGAYQTSGTFTGLAAGNYTVTAKSSAGCLGSAQTTLTTTNPCTNTNITLTSVVVDFQPCVTPNSGKITVTAAGSSGYTYNINNGAYQASNIFSALAAGAYTIGVKDLNGCTKTATATVGTAASGPLFASMRTLITTRCSGSGCHMNGANAAGYNFDSDCNIVSKWSQINGACVTYTLVKMPKSPQALLTTAEKAVITNWINAGHLRSN